MFPRLYRRLVGPGHRLRLIVLVVLLALGVAVGGHLYAQRLAASDLAERDSTIQVLRSEGEKLGVHIYAQREDLFNAMHRI